MMLAERALLYTGGAGSCSGCGEGTALRMMLAATGYTYGAQNAGVVAATGCNTVAGSTYPYNAYRVPWTNSLFENAPAVAMGVRARWDQLGWKDRRLWVVGGDGAMLDIGFQSLSRMLMSGMDIKVLVLDTQVYSNTGGQASTASFPGQETKMSYSGKALRGKTERRKELGLLAMMHPEVFVAQTTPAHANHFYRAVLSANKYPGPALVNAYAVCQPEHGVADDAAYHQARLAVTSRAFPLFVHDPRRGARLAERLDLKGNPAPEADWYVHPKTGEAVDFCAFARSEGRFAGHFDSEGRPSSEMLRAQEERLANWRLLRELAGQKQP
jgi:pyruvate/2-oxoacid:ferredoxin oxidoreductase beta subunit